MCLASQPLTIKSFPKEDEWKENVETRIILMGLNMYELIKQWKLVMFSATSIWVPELLPALLMVIFSTTISVMGPWTMKARTLCFDSTHVLYTLAEIQCHYQLDTSALMG